MKCPECGGRGFKELEHGLIMVECEDCGGTGEIEDAVTVIVNKPRKPRKRKLK